MLLQGYIRDFLKQNPEKSFAQKPNDRRILKAVRILNNNPRLGHYYSNWSRFLLEEHGIGENRSFSDSNYYANIVFANGHTPLVKITPYVHKNGQFVIYRIENAIKPQTWMLEHKDLVKNVVNWVNKHAKFGKSGHVNLLRPNSNEYLETDRDGNIVATDNPRINYTNQFIPAGNPQRESHSDFRHDA